MFETIYEKASVSISIITGFLFGGWDVALTILIVLMCFDYITGLSKAIKNKNLNSTIARWGIFQKFLMLIPICLSNLMDIVLKLNGTMLSICVIFYVLSEGLSICENLAELGIKLPKQLLAVLEKAQSSNDNKPTGKE